MSGHSKWASIKNKKGAADAKRGQIFSKLSKLIEVAAKEGGADVGMNFSLRLLVEKAKKSNMPKENIERAIERGSGTGGGTAMISAVYEAMGPGGAAIIIETLTDNTNRTLGNVKSTITKRGGNFGAKVLWLFDHKGVIRVDDVSSVSDRDTVELELIEAGAEDITFDDNGLTVLSSIQDLKTVVDAIKSAGLESSSAGIEYIAKDDLAISSDDEEKLMALLEAIEEDDDVTNVYTNAG
ncbi:MAG: YebC/PmpR family DNA-binding transcriptional regulator [Candidatus Uhrbacteria bacterium]|nr:YebC/PmpR family DNA-binding transcriptional regulator [Candidatus Uhrbacteria bacterium]